MRKAIGTSIRCATSALRKLERYRQQQLNALQDENIDLMREMKKQMMQVI